MIWFSIRFSKILILKRFVLLFYSKKKKRVREKERRKSKQKVFVSETFKLFHKIFVWLLFKCQSNQLFDKKAKKKNKANFWFCLFCWNVNFVNKVELVLSLFMVNHFQGYPRSNGYSSLFLFWFKRSKVLKLIFVEMRQKFEIKL